jgi:hypothetical protein
MKLNNLLHYLLEVKRPSKKIPAEPPEVPEGYKNPPLGQYLFAPVRMTFQSQKKSIRMMSKK